MERLRPAGAGAIVRPFLFEEQIVAERHALEARTQAPAISVADAQSYFPNYDCNGCGHERHLDIVRRAKASIAIPVIASLNCTTRAGWVYYARALQEDDAEAIELNLYFIHPHPGLSGRDVEHRHINILAMVKASVSIPVAVKYLLAGADVVMTTSSLLRYGVEHMRKLLNGLAPCSPRMSRAAPPDTRPDEPGAHARPCRDRPRPLRSNFQSYRVRDSG